MFWIAAYLVCYCWINIEYYQKAHIRRSKNVVKKIIYKNVIDLFKLDKQNFWT